MLQVIQVATREENVRERFIFHGERQAREYRKFSGQIENIWEMSGENEV